MNYRRASIAAILCSLSMIGAILAMGVMADRAMARGKVCHEDERCWRWSTMGNLQRGVILHSRKYPGGYFRVVDPCEFAYLDWAGRIDWRRTDPLRGDTFARRHGCDPSLYA